MGARGGFARRGSFGRRAFARGAAGRGGWRRRNWFHATGTPGWFRFGPAWGPAADVEPLDKAKALKARAEWLRGELDAIDQRLGELDETK
jgi:hypothetical protein